MLNINLNLLRTFATVADHGGLRAAAVVMAKSPSALSMQMQQLEATLGVALFSRAGRGIALTPTGTKLLAGCKRGFADIEAALAETRQTADTLKGRLSIACVPTIASTLLPGALVRFGERYPAMRVQVVELASDALHDAVRRRLVDFGIGPSRPDEDFSYRPLLEDEACALVLPDAGRPPGDGIPLAALAGMPLLRLAASTAFSSDIDEAFARRGLTPRFRHEVAQVATLVAMAEAGLGGAILPRTSLPRTTRLSAHPITDPAIRRVIALITLNGQPLLPAAERFSETLVQTFAADARSSNFFAST